MTTVIVIAIVVLAVMGAPMFAVLGAFAILGMSSLLHGMSTVTAFANALTRVLHLATSSDATTLATIPLFTFMGYLLAESKTADRLVAFAKAVVGWFPGGLAIVTVLVCAMFTTVTGASGVTIIAVGGLVMPALIKEGYKERFALGLVTGTGSIGLLFPPALPLIIYGIVYGVNAQGSAGGSGDSLTLVDFSLDKFLLAGIVPGLVLCGMVAMYAVYVAVRDKIPRTKFVPKEAARATLKALPELAIPIVVVVALKIGLQIPEAGAFAVCYVFVLEAFVYKDIKPKDLPRIVREAMRLVGAIFILIVAATALTDYFIKASIPDKMYAWLEIHIHSKLSFLLALNVFLLLVGCVMDIFSALIVVVPLIAPAATHYGVDPYHLGVIFLLNLEVGYIHPPVGLNLFISSFRFRKPMTELYWAILPYLVIMIAALMLVTYVPQLSPVKSKMSQQGDQPTAVEQPTEGDGGPAMAKEIPLPDGTFLKLEDCEKPEVKDDQIAYVECKAKFTLWPKCATLPTPLDKLDCEQKVLDGEDPFAEEPEEDEAADAGAAMDATP